MIVKLSKNYFNKYINRIILLLLNIQFISYEFAENICEEIRNNFNLYSGCSFLCIERDTLLGIIIARSAENCILNKNVCEIQYLSVKSDFKRKGIASSLIEHLKKRCRGHFDCLYLTVYENNPEAIEFYEKMGFSRYILNNKPQIVLRDAGTSIEHKDICMTCDLTGMQYE